MKVYRYYDKTRENIYSDRIEDKYPLVAITNDKKLAKDFEKTRKMNKLIRISDKMDKDMYIAYVNKHRGEEIDKDSLFISFDEKGHQNDVYIPHTWMEKSMVEDTGDSLLSNPNIVQADPRLLNKKYIKALDLLGYVQIYKLNNRLADDYDMPSFVMDELSIFINIYGNYLDI